MKRGADERGSGSIFRHTLFLATGVVLMMAAATVTLILIIGPPYDPPVTAYEIGRLLSDKPISRGQGNFQTNFLREPPDSPRDPGAQLMRTAVARHLGRDPADIFFEASGTGLLGAGAGSDSSRRYAVQLAREAELYAAEGQFNPLTLAPFRAGLKEQDGRWRVVSRAGNDSMDRWQLAMIQWIGLVVLFTVPIVWLFSKRIAMPIRAFATAAERLGRNSQVELVAVKGPSEIRLAARSLNDMQCRLQGYVAERTSMIGAIAHDLRTPLSRLGFLLAPAPDELRAKCEAEIAEMERMIAVTLDFVQNETRLPAHEAVDLQLLVEGIVDDLADIGQDAEMEVGTPVTVNGDPVLLKRLFANLITNAVIYGKQARVSIRVDGSHAVVDVGDNGPGLPEAELERVFTPFYRSEPSRNRATGGMGLGLAIVRAAAASHGGEVRLFNRPNGGLCARVTLPIARAAK